MKINKCSFCGRGDEYADLPDGIEEPDLTNTPENWILLLGIESAEKAYNSICERRRFSLDYDTRMFYLKAKNIIEKMEGK